MENEILVEYKVIEKLINLNTDLAGKGSCVAWTTFPYNSVNLKVVENAIKKLKWDQAEYNLNYDENFIFVEKDLL
ncbi:MAG: hypothetical protein QMD61_08140 [Methanobacterium sp.]|mgnify:CR=1 FL=1|nr:hypothetical protein [Methanobacterium sp.]